MSEEQKRPTLGELRRQTAGIVCPKCGCSQMPAISTQRIGVKMVRRRKCRLCGHVVVSSERIENTRT